MLSSKLRPIAIHLPQFHPIPENDEWWGKGFTEWTNVAKANPLFKGHYQPHLPADLGFYDLRLEEARLAQEALAKEYGIYGFCYYHYWFNGKRLLHEPVDRKLKNQKEDLPFMLCWANENWTRRWDGGDETVLLKQDYSAQDDINQIRALLPYFGDSRYIRVNDKPVFAIYKSSLLPDMKATTERWRNEAARHGIELYLCKFETLNAGLSTPAEEGFDAAIEFQPSYGIFSRYIKDAIHAKRIKSIGYRLSYRYNAIRGRLDALQRMKDLPKWRLDYADFVHFLTRYYEYPSHFKRFPCVVPSWDNTARRGIDANLFYNATPASFEQWLSFHAAKFQPYSAAENFVFINAWNEWAEGNHLEPCQQWGRAYLEAVQRAFTQRLY